MYAKASGWNFDEKQDIHKDLKYTHNMCINYKDKN